MKYLITGTSEANKNEVIKGLESLWDAADEQDQPFSLLVKESDLRVPLIKEIKDWGDSFGEGFEDLIEVVDDALILPPYDVALVLVGEEPDEWTLGLASALIDKGVEVRDLAGQMVRLEFETEQVPQEPPTESVEPIPAATSALAGGWPGEDPVVPATAPEPERSREVPAKAPEAVQDAPEDAAAILKGVTEEDLDHMPVPALKALVERLGLAADKRAKGSMIAAIMEKIIELDKAEVSSLADSGAYDQDATEYFGGAVQEDVVAEIKAELAERPIDVGSMEARRTIMTTSDGTEVPVTRVPLREEFVEPSVTVVAKFIETVYSDGSVTKQPLADF